MGGGVHHDGGRSHAADRSGAGGRHFDHPEGRRSDSGIGRFDRAGNNPFLGNRADAGAHRSNAENRRHTGDRTHDDRGDHSDRWGRGGWGYRHGWHHGWVNGYWGGHYWRGGWGGWWAGLATGAALGGLAGWGLGTGWYGWGYGSYVNPYYSPTVVVQPPAVVGQPDSTPVYNYAQPIDTGAPLPDDATVQAASNTLDQAREAFAAGDYTRALQLADQALKATPNDVTAHEFRALCLFALGRYDEAAAVLYAVLSVGPGWDWTTLIGLYPFVDVYTQQLRALESYRDQHPDSAAARFVLAYHYLTQGHTEDAVAQLQEVARLQPSNQLAAQLVKVLSGEPPPADEAEPPAQPAPAGTPGTLTGNWTANPAKGTTIRFTAGPGDAFTWNVDQNGQKRPIQGKLTFADGLLTLVPSNNAQPLVGQVTWQDPSHFTFKLAGGPPSDPGLSFTKGPG